MFLRLPLTSARRFAALLLLLGVMLGGTIDAAACEPAVEAAVSVMTVENDTNEHELPGGDHDGVCIHGHCHHGISHIQPMAALGALSPYQSDHPPGRDQSLSSIIPDTLKRPPRA